MAQSDAGRAAAGGPGVDSSGFGSAFDALNSLALAAEHEAGLSKGTFGTSAMPAHTSGSQRSQPETSQDDPITTKVRPYKTRFASQRDKQRPTVCHIVPGEGLGADCGLLRGQLAGRAKTLTLCVAQPVGLAASENHTSCLLGGGGGRSVVDLYARPMWSFSCGVHAHAKWQAGMHGAPCA